MNELNDSDMSNLIEEEIEEENDSFSDLQTAQETALQSVWDNSDDAVWDKT